MTMLRPTELVFAPFAIDRQALIKVVSPNQAVLNRGFMTTPIHSEGKPVQLMLNGAVAYKGIKTTEFENEQSKAPKVVTHTLSMEMDDEADYEAFEVITARIRKLLPEWDPKEEGDEVTEWQPSLSYLYQGKLTLKLKTTHDQKKFDFKSSVRLVPMESNATTLYNGRSIRIMADVSVWFNLNKKTFGLFFTVRQLQTRDDGKKKERKDGTTASGPVEVQEVPLLFDEEAVKRGEPPLRRPTAVSATTSNGHSSSGGGRRTPGA